jgi:hypothetical protein
MGRIKKAILTIAFLQILTFLYVNQILNKNKANDSIGRFFASSNQNNDPRQYKVVMSNEWILNFNISLYSSIIYYEQDNSVIQTESLAFINRDIEDIKYLRSHLKCLFKWNGSDLIFEEPIEIYEINFKRMPRGPKSIWRIKCQLNLHEYEILDINNFYITLIDYKYFDYHSNLYKNNLNEIIIFQKPRLVNKLKQKKKQVAHCLHKVIDLDKNRFNMLMNWIYMQKEIGIAKIKLCLFDINSNQQSTMKYVFGDYIEIVNHKTKITQICNWQMAKAHQHTNSRTYKFILDNCKKLAYIHFQMKHYPTFQHQQMICTQDCYAEYRNEYEYVTNYDFDELILPRMNGYNTEQNLKIIVNTTDQCSTNDTRLPSMKYNIYDLATYLFSKYGKHNAYVKFRQVVFFNDFKTLLRKIKLNETSEINDGTLSLRYSYKGRSISYQIKKDDDYYFKSFNRIEEYFTCLKKSHIDENDQILDNHFNNPYATHLFFGREGKSIFNTDLTESYDAHGAKNTTYPNAKHVLIPLEIGYVNHFRSNMNKYFSHVKTYPFNFIKIDVEYYHFLINCLNQPQFKNMTKIVAKKFQL